ncbi:MAG TPA: trypsin-like peptidase domain-containing protein [Candidatus Faecivivens stercoripullorum]|uniref:Trypsin-like peptidase domain-containing protein n=1 Tax=Candidatus Faecivivens stercoripullorum TaxID=2840805 RepID=A0A9D1H802_9FIRM|nr:trypsin-like peptidase domain-containing protein [Candidatus Faecivivens stercoripullorum]
MNENGEYRYSYEDYNRISYNPNGTSARGRNGIKVFAIIVTVLLVITTTVLLGLTVSSQQPLESQLSVTTETSSEVSESSSMQRPDQDEIEVPELNITSHAEEDTYISSDGKLTTTQIHEKVRPSVVGILNYSAENSLTADSSGSGIIVSSDGYILTNAHVISGAANLVVVLDNNEEYAAQLIGSDVSTDLAVIKIDAENLTAAELGDSDQLKVGEPVVAIGNPAGLNLAGSTTRGIVSGLDRTISVTLETGESISMEVIQTDAAINPGNSGGPLINEYGQVIGINSSRLSSSSYDGIGFAIPVNDALPVVEDLIQYGYVTGRVKLGITYYPISEVVGAMSGYTPGLLVYSVDVTMDVYAKGLRAGDIITEMDGKSVTSKEAIKTILDGKKPGDTLKITFVRGSSDNQASYSVDVILGVDTGNSDTSSYSSEPGTAEGVPTTADGTQSFT